MIINSFCSRIAASYSASRDKTSAWTLFLVSTKPRLVAKKDELAAHIRLCARNKGTLNGELQVHLHVQALQKQCCFKPVSTFMPSASVTSPFESSSVFGFDEVELCNASLEDWKPYRGIKKMVWFVWMSTCQVQQNVVGASVDLANDNRGLQY